MLESVAAGARVLHVYTYTAAVWDELLDYQCGFKFHTLCARKLCRKRISVVSLIVSCCEQYVVAVRMVLPGSLSGLSISATLIIAIEPRRATGRTGNGNQDRDRNRNGRLPMCTHDGQSDSSG